MSTERDVTRIVRSWLDEGVTQLPDRVLDAVLDHVPATPQRRPTWPARRLPDMNTYAKVLLSTAAVVAIAVVGISVIPREGGIGGTSPSPTPTPTPSSTPAAQGGIPKGPFLAVEATTGLPSITVTIPAADWTWDAVVDALGKGGEVKNVPTAVVLLWSYPAATGFDVYGDPCRWKSSAPRAPAKTVDDFATALAAQPSRDGTAPGSVTVGGYAAKSLTLHVPEDAVFTDCDDGNFTSYGVATDGGTEPSRWHQGPGQIDELWIVDVGDTTVVLDAMYGPDTSAELVGELRAIAESATFELP